MKTFILSIVCLLNLEIPVCAQTTSAEMQKDSVLTRAEFEQRFSKLKFLSVPVNGTKESFSSALIEAEQFIRVDNNEKLKDSYRNNGLTLEPTDLYGTFYRYKVIVDSEYSWTGGAQDPRRISKVNAYALFSSADSAVTCYNEISNQYIEKPHKRKNDSIPYDKIGTSGWLKKYESRIQPYSDENYFIEVSFVSPQKDRYIVQISFVNLYNALADFKVESILEEANEQPESPVILSKPKYLNIEIDGKKEDMIRNLKKIGYHIQGNVLIGNFYGYNVSLDLTESRKGNVYLLSISKKRMSLDTAKSFYNNIFSRLSKLHNKINGNKIPMKVITTSYGRLDNARTGATFIQNDDYQQEIQMIFSRDYNANTYSVNILYSNKANL